MSQFKVIETIYAPRHKFLAFLAAGWRFVNDVAEPMPGHHGTYSILMEREARDG